MTDILIKMGNLDKTCTEGKECEETQRKNGHLQPKERGLKQIFPLQPSEVINPANTLILDCEPLEVLHNNLLCKSPNLCSFVMAALGS